MSESRIDLLHILGEVPEGRWAIFSLPHGDGTQMLSVVVPHTLWSLISRNQPFVSDVGLMEQVGTAAIRHRSQQGEISRPLVVTADDLNIPIAANPEWFEELRRCQKCGQNVPPGEILEGLSNAVPPDGRGEVEILVLCPPCQFQSHHRLTPYGIAKA
ncbi:MAG: hypothetical protein M1415_03005 [Firmicutes bacterium]|jgi:hypothetical protein|nr:hypothetical protein [Bacillota bacterium]